MSDVFNEAVAFKDMGLRDSVLKGVEKAGFEYPTDIQARLIPEVLSGKDVIGQARTGTGKTAGFALPILHMADKSKPMSALILVPTRELAAQVAGEIDALGQFTPIRTACIIGGESIRQQVKAVKGGGHIIVGTPGRVMDLCNRRQINFDNIQHVVLDEVDRMLDIGFREDIRKILKTIKTEHQTVFVSATIDEQIEKLARSFMKPDATKIIAVSGSLTVSLVDQKYFAVEPWDKRALLLHLLKNQELDTTLVFCRTKMTVHKVTQHLRKHKIDAREIHGDLDQNKRNRVMSSMRGGKLSVLVASDLAARGLDIEHISHVINYDLPEDPEVYVHRIGRTARVGRRGCAWSFVSPDQGQLLTQIEKLTGVLIEKMEYPDFKPGSVPEDVRVERQRQEKLEEVRQTDRDRVAPSVPQGLNDKELKAMFPDGNIPRQPPPRTLGSKFRSRRRR